MGVIEIFGGMGKTSKVYRYPFYKLKSYPIIHFYIKEKKKCFNAENIEKLSKYYCFSHSRASRIQ